MLDPLDFKNRPLISGLQRKRRLASLVLLLERLTLALWRPVTWVLFFCGLWLFYLPPVFGMGGQVGTLIAFILGLGYLLYKDLRALRLPHEQDIDRRIERDSQIKHRPLTALKDTLSNPQKTDTRSLWEISRQQILTILPRLKVGLPEAFMARKDPYALRLAVILFFTLGIFVAGPAWKDRIQNGLTPITLSGALPEKDVSLWITPPDYTKMQQVILQGGKSGKLSIPEGSALKVNVRGGIGQPALYIDDRSWPLEYAGDDNYSIEMTVQPGSKLRIKQMFIPRASWGYEIVTDKPPVITTKADPAPLPDGPVRFSFTLYDDYGVKSLSMAMKLDPVVEESPAGKPAEETRSVMSPAKIEFDVQPVYDLTSHPWAGLPAVFTFTATDHKGQSRTSDPVSMVLPERHFTHPVAQALIAERKKLAWNPEDNYEMIGREIESLLSAPHLYQDDIIVFLAIRSAASRLLHADPPSPAIAESVIDILWSTALRLEDGNLTLAARNLRDAQKALENALENPDISNQEISRLMQELREAMAEYLMELQRELQKQMAEGKEMPMIPPELLSQAVDPDALAGFLDQMEAEMRNGDKNKAQEMLSQLQRLMDAMDPSMAAPMPPDMQMMAQGANELQELIDRQEELLGQTKKQAEIYATMQEFVRNFGDNPPTDSEIMEEWAPENMPPQPEAQEGYIPPSLDTEANRTEQEALRLVLGQLMMEAGEVLPDIPENMGKAEQEMRGSSTALGGSRPDESVPHQEQALEYLKQSQQQLSKQFMARMKQMTGFRFSGSGMKYDPLGRPYGGDGDDNGIFPGSRVKIPDEAEQKKAQEILRLLRRRAGELDRPDEELEYYRRLLRQF